MICHYCKEDPGLKRGSEVIWNGFLDRDMDLRVCNRCKQLHYVVKSKTEHAHQYSEFPIVIPPAQLTIFN